MAYTNTNTERGIENINGDLVVVTSNVLNNETIGIDVEVTKKNTDGSGFASNVYGSKTYSKGDSEETIVNIAGSWSKAEHIGSGTSYYVYGSIERGHHNGVGNSTTIAGALNEAKVIGDGAGTHQYVLGNNQIAVLDNPNAKVNFLQGAHCTIQVVDGEVLTNAMALILDLDHTGGTISGDFEYLRIQNDPFDSPVGGNARAINSLSPLPSEFGGSIKANSFIDTGVSEHNNNADAITAGLAVGTHYRTGDLLKIVH
tara:strand:- start:57 stop:827 length:771 start_codon:yes stop_codon:yes gene_type:complete